MNGASRSLLHLQHGLTCEFTLPGIFFGCPVFFSYQIGYYTANLTRMEERLMKVCIVLTLLLALSLAPAVPGLAQTSEEIGDLKKEIEVLKEGQKAMQKELQEIKDLLRTQRAPAPFKEGMIDIAGDPFKGVNTAKLVLIEFSEYQ